MEKNQDKNQDKNQRKNQRKNIETEFIVQSLEEYAKAIKLYKYLKKNSKIEYVRKPDGRKIMKFIDNDTGGIIFQSEVEILGIYHRAFDIWCWAWSIPLLDRADVGISKQLLHYMIKLEYDTSYIKTMYITARGVMSDPIQVDIIIATAISIAKCPFVWIEKDIIEDSPICKYMMLLNVTDAKTLYQKIFVTTDKKN
jgi:uncharacterized FlaG/YvyC family protein